MINYFNLDCSANEKRDYLLLRKSRNLVNGLRNVFFFGVGDIVEVVYFRKNLPFIFEGVCISLRKKKTLKEPNVSFILRNVILGVGIEMIFAYYYNRLYNLKLYDYKRKLHFVRRSRLYYIRGRLNRESRVI